MNNNTFKIRMEAKHKIFELLFKNRDYSLLPYKRLMQILDDIESVILLMTEDDFHKNQIRENKAKLYNKFYLNNYVYIYGMLENNSELVSNLSKKVCDESILYKKNLEELAGPKTKSIIVKQNNRKNIKVQMTFTDIQCKMCGLYTVKEIPKTSTADEIDVFVKYCYTCDK